MNVAIQFLNSVTPHGAQLFPEFPYLNDPDYQSSHMVTNPFQYALQAFNGAEFEVNFDHNYKVIFCTTKPKLIEMRFFEIVPSSHYLCVDSGSW